MIKLSLTADGSETVATEVRYRASFTFPAPLARDISRLAKRLGVSQSAMLTELLTEPIAAMCSIIDTLPTAGATEDDVRRAKGRSVALIKEVVDQAQALMWSDVMK